jgi:D-alanine-D-alanine ligase-like ATP-grasp enzyme
MSPVNLATVYHGIALTKDSQAAMSVRKHGWEALAQAVARHAGAMDTAGVRQVFNAVGAMEPARLALTQQAWSKKF